MFGKRKRQVKNVMFVQPPKGEAYFYTPLAYATTIPNSKEEGKEVFKDSDLALAGKLKLIFEREKMIWFEIKEKKLKTSFGASRFFGLYYYPHRLVKTRSTLPSEKATLTEIRALFEFFVTEEQNRPAKVQQNDSPSAYGWIIGESQEKSEPVTIIANDFYEELEDVPVISKHTKS